MQIWQVYKKNMTRHDYYSDGHPIQLYQMLPTFSEIGKHAQLAK
jgi:hypothetical protein